MTSTYRYFREMGKYALLTAEEEISISTEACDALEKLIDRLLDLPCTWSAILNHRERIMQEGKSANKMAEDYGHPKLSAEVLSYRVDGNICAAIENIFSWSKEPSDLLFYTIKGQFKAAYLSQHIYSLILEQLLRFLEEGDPSSFLSVAGCEKNELERHCAELVALRELIHTKRECLVNANLRLVINFAKRYQGMGVPLLDLIQEGNIGLIRAAEKFDPSRKFRFSTYAAHWIKQAFLKAIKNTSKTVRLPSHIHDLVVNTIRTRERLAYDLRREPTITEVATELGTTADFIERLMELMQEPIPLETPLKSCGSGAHRGTLKDFIAVDSVDPVADIDKQRLAADVDITLKDLLSPRECKVIAMRYGLGEEEEHTLQEIAAKLKKSRERIRQIEGKAIKKLKDHSKLLKEHMR